MWGFKLAICAHASKSDMKVPQMYKIIIIKTKYI